MKRVYAVNSVWTDPVAVNQIYVFATQELAEQWIKDHPTNSEKNRYDIEPLDVLEEQPK